MIFVLKKLSFFIVIAILCSACGAEAPTLESLPTGEGSPVFAASGSDATMKTEVLPGPEPIPATEPEVHQPEYFLLDRQQGTRQNEDGLTMLYEQFCRASFSTADTQRGQWVDSVLDTIQVGNQRNSDNLYQYAKEFVAQEGSETFYSYSNYHDLDILRHDEAVVSMISTSSLYSGGAHPNSVQTAYNLDIDRARLLELEDVIYENSVQALTDLVKQTVEDNFAVFGEGALFSDYRQTIDAAMTYGSMTPYWYFDNEGLVIFFNQYALGPYASGIICAQLDYEDLRGILKDDWFPQPGDGQSTDLVLRTEAGEDTIISIVLDLDGQSLLVGAEGMVYQVQLSEVHFLDDRLIDSQLLFSAKSMCENDVLQVTGGFDQTSRSFRLTFVSGTGEQKTYYLNPNGLTTQP